MPLSPSANLHGAPPPAASANGGGMLKSTVEPAANAAGFIFKITEKDTGRVIIELPSQLPIPASSSALRPPAQLLDLTA
ncbi:MAG: hypothetical protein ACHP7N_13545 [Caulobacterales bacterium]